MFFGNSSELLGFRILASRPSGFYSSRRKVGDPPPASAETGRISPASLLKIWGGYVVDSIRGLMARLFAWSFLVAVAAGVRRGDLLRKSPSTTALMKDARVVFATKADTGG